MTNRLLLPLLLLPLAVCSEATSYPHRNTSELIDSSDAIVVGRVEGSSDSQQKIIVIRTLEGSSPAQFEFRRLPDERPPGTSLIYIFLLKKEHGRLRIFHPGCLLPETSSDEVDRLLKLRRDPSPVLDSAKCPPTPDVVHTVSSAFDGFKIRSGPYEELPFQGDRDVWKYIPWQDKVAVSLVGTVDQTGKATVQIKLAPSGSLLAEYLRRCLEATANGSTSVTKPYWVEVDARIPDRVGNLSRTDALNYLRQCLKADDPWVVVEAIKALATLRDQESLALIRPLVDHPSAYAPIASYAEQFVAAATRHTDGVQFP